MRQECYGYSRLGMKNDLVAERRVVQMRVTTDRARLSCVTASLNVAPLAIRMTHGHMQGHHLRRAKRNHFAGATIAAPGQVAGGQSVVQHDP